MRERTVRWHRQLPFGRRAAYYCDGLALVPGTRTFGGAQLSWNEASDNRSTAPNLEYIVVHSLSDNVAGAAQQILARSGVTIRARVRSLFATIVFPTAARDHFLTVLVSDEAGNTAVYPRIRVTVNDPPNCTANNQCLFGACTTFFEDADGDRFGNRNQTTGRCSTTPPPGFVSRPGDGRFDCCDLPGQGVDFRPDQVALFSTATPACSHEGDIDGWDYNCSGRVEVTHNVTAAAGVEGCTDLPNVGDGSCEQPFWSPSTPPPCGESGDVITCTTFPEFGGVCAVDTDNPLLVQTIVNRCN